MTLTLPQPASDGLDQPRLSFFLPEGAVLCRSAALPLARCLEFASEARAIFFLSLNPILPPSSSHGLPLPSLSERGGTEGKHTPGGN